MSVSRHPCPAVDTSDTNHVINSARIFHHMLQWAQQMKLTTACFDYEVNTELKPLYQHIAAILQLFFVTSPEEIRFSR